MYICISHLNLYVHICAKTEERERDRDKGKGGGRETERERSFREICLQMYRHVRSHAGLCKHVAKHAYRQVHLGTTVIMDMR